MTFKNVSLRGPKRTFLVDLLNGRPTGLGRFEEASVLEISSREEMNAQTRSDAPLARLEVVDIAGIDLALKKLNRFLSNFDRKFKYTWAQRSCAVLLHGGHGTGKTFIMDKITSTGWGKVYKIENDAKPPSIRAVFKDAKLSQPSIIIIDEFDSLVSKDDATSHNISKTLGEELDYLIENHPKNSLPRVLVVAATLDSSNIPLSLKKRGRFRTDISLRIPDAAARKAILKSLAPPVHPDFKNETLDKLGDKTHAYTAEDLVSLLDTACEIAEEKSEARNEEVMKGNHYLAQEDIEQAMLLVRPTAMHDITLQPPTVRWDEIGGQDSVKKALRRAVETPLLVSNLIWHPLLFVLNSLVS